MVFKAISRGEAQKAMDDWIQNYPELPSISSEYKTIRESIESFNATVRSDVIESQATRPDYYVDAHLGLLLYEYLWTLPGFSMRVAANDGFWRFMSIHVAPHVVAQRWGKDNNDHYWSKPARIWLRSIWWYVHLCWQGDTESTRKVLESEHFNTDTILNLEERIGRKGTYVTAYRKIVFYYSQVPTEKLKSFSASSKSKKDDMFRVVMKLNTAKMVVIDPALCLGGEDAYAKGLFRDVGVNF